MAWVSVSELRKQTVRGSISSDSAITYAIDKASCTKNEAYAIRIGLSAVVAASIGVHSGDRVEVLFDQSANLCKISKAKHGIKAVSSHKNRTARVYIKTTWASGMASVPQSVACTDFICSKDEVVFTIPEPVSFTENLRVTV